MAVNLINIEKIYNLNKIPENIIKVFLIYIVSYIFLFFLVFMMQCKFEESKSKISSNQNKYNKLTSGLNIVINYLCNLMYKIIVLTTTLSTLLVIFFLAMDGIFSITTDVIVTLYKSIGVDNLDLFKALVGPIITVLVLSLSVFGSILSKSYLKKVFDDINNRVERLPEYLNRMYVFFIEHIKLAYITIIITMIFFLAIFLIYKYF